LGAWTILGRKCHYFLYWRAKTETKLGGAELTYATKTHTTDSQFACRARSLTDSELLHRTSYIWKDSIWIWSD